MESLMVDTYMFFCYNSANYIKRLSEFNKKLDPKIVFYYSTGYGLEDEDELYDFLAKYMVILRKEV